MKNKILKTIVMILMIGLVISNMFSTFATSEETDNENSSTTENTQVDNTNTGVAENVPVENNEIDNPPVQNEVENDVPQENIVENNISDEKPIENNISNNTDNNTNTNNEILNETTTSVNEMEIDPRQSTDEVNQAIHYATKEQKLDLEGKGLKNLVIYGYDNENKQYVLAISPDFNTNIYNYKIQAGLNIKNIEIEYELIDEDGTIEKYGKTELEPGVNFITIIARNADFSENVTYQISINKLDSSVLPTYDGLDENADSLRLKRILLYGCIGVIVVCAIIFIVLEFILGKREKTPESVRERNKMNVESILKSVEEKDEEPKPKKSKGKH